MQEIVGAVINGSTVTNDVVQIAKAIKNDRCNKLLDRKSMQFMSACDLGRNWDILASSPTLFIIDDNGNPKMVKKIKEV